MTALFTLLTAANPLPLVLWATAYFFLIYFFFAGLAWCLAKVVGRPLETRLRPPAQIRTEILVSLRSILLFGLGMALPWAMLASGLVGLDAHPSSAKIALDCLLLILWNDLHFYGMHRLLHEYLKKAHVLHHRSVAATPFASFSMSVTEAVLLGSVMPLAMLAHDFSLPALLFLPVWSICINSLAHANCDLFPKASEDSLPGFIKHHQSHHSRYHGNYSFLFARLDRWFGTAQTKPQQGTS